MKSNRQLHTVNRWNKALIKRKKRVLKAETDGQLESFTKTRRLTVDTAAVKRVKYRELQGFDLLN
jgi:hypothetical protein